MIVPEAFYQRALATYLLVRGFRVREEFAYGRRRFDVVAYDGISIHGFEVKCLDWQRAMKQARYQQLCCDSVTIVVPSAHLRKTLLAAAEDAGIGVITIGNPPDWTVSRILESRTCDSVPLHRRQILMLSGWVS
jgi:hypothetical protein